MGDVVSHERFQINEEQLGRLKAMGVEVLPDIPSDDDLDLKPLKPGEALLDLATDDEMRLYATLVKTNREGNDIFMKGVKSVAGQVLEKMANAGSVEEIFSNWQGTEGPKLDPAYAPSLWEVRQRYMMLHALLWYGVSHRLEAHHKHLNIRRGRKIVTTGDRA